MGHMGTSRKSTNEVPWEMLNEMNSVDQFLQAPCAVQDTKEEDVNEELTSLNSFHSKPIFPLYPIIAVCSQRELTINFFSFWEKIPVCVFISAGCFSRCPALYCLQPCLIELNSATFQARDH